MSNRTARDYEFVHRRDVMPLLGREAEKFDQNADGHRKNRKANLKTLWDELIALQRKGHPMSRSEQIILEAKWLINYTLDWKAVDRRLTDAKESMVDLNQDVQEQGEDGAFDSGACKTLYRKLEPTIEALQDRDLDPATLKPLKFMRRFADPKRLIDRLWQLQITDIARTGCNHRDELGATQTAFSQLIFKDNLRAILDDPASRLGFRITENLECSYLDYVRQTQHPRTGYWGPWYRVDGRLLMVQDLSFTYHQISYRQGNVELWPQIIDTTLRIKDLSYPMGWKNLERDTGQKFYSNHHNYDVVQIFAYGWSRMTKDQKESVRNEIKLMLDWCLKTSVQNDAFDGDPSDESYYFGVRFLDRVGYFDDTKRFWTKGHLVVPHGALGPYDLAQRLRAGLERTVNKSNMADHALKILSAAMRLNAPSGH
jgi:hypothetical protein